MADNLSLRDKLVGLQGNLFNFACRLTANRDTAQDLVQDTTLKELAIRPTHPLNVSQESGLTTPEGSYAVKEISKAIGAFSQEYRVPFSMYIAGYKYGEIAEKMGLALGTVKSRIFFARKRLQSILSEYK